MEDRTLTNCDECWQNNRPKNVVSVADPVQVAPHVVQGSECVKADASPHHHGPATIAVVLLDDGDQEPLSVAPPDPVPPIVDGRRG